jgi:RHS repeat-associated protein
VPLAQATKHGLIQLKPTTNIKELMISNGGDYDSDLDPIWADPPPEPVPFSYEQMHYYHCDHLGTPTEMTDCDGHMSWAAKHKAWGAAKVAISDAAEKAGIKNPFRFQGQYFDEESGLHYNRYRYYDPHSGRFVSKDPIGLAGGINLHQYAPNPLQWVDPLGLTSGKAVITHYDTGSRTGHYTVETHQGERKVHTHQVITDGNKNTTIIDEKKHNLMGADPIARRVEIPLPDAAAAQRYQRSVEGGAGGTYDEATNSCMTHVGNVLCAGGVAAPKNPRGLGSFFKKLGFKLGLRRP